MQTRSYFYKGVLASLPFVLVVCPFALLFGVLAADAGLNIVETMGFSIVVLAGASQFTALAMLQENAPTVIIILTSLAVNLRMAMYSAALAPHLGPAPLWQRALVAYGLVDQSFVLSDQAYQQNPNWSVTQKVVYFFGSTILICGLWFVFTYVGAIIGGQLPPWLALDFALPLAFLAMIAPALRSMPHLAAAITSIICAFAFAGFPYGTGLLTASFCAMIVGAELERRMAK
ncbi:MAG: AzlC family ABC transporter permease [Planktomarina sp.]